MGAAGVRKKTDRQLKELRKRVEHCLRVNSEDGVCTLAIGALVERFGGIHDTIHEVADKMGIEIPHQRSHLEVAYSPPPEVAGSTRVDRMKRRITATCQSLRAEKRAVPPGPVCMQRIPDGGARETIRERMQPHPCAEVT